MRASIRGCSVGLNRIYREQNADGMLKGSCFSRETCDKVVTATMHVFGNDDLKENNIPREGRTFDVVSLVVCI